MFRARAFPSCHDGYQIVWGWFGDHEWVVCEWWWMLDGCLWIDHERWWMEWLQDASGLVDGCSGANGFWPIGWLLVEASALDWHVLASWQCYRTPRKCELRPLWKYSSQGRLAIMESWKFSKFTNQNRLTSQPPKGISQSKLKTWPIIEIPCSKWDGSLVHHQARKCWPHVKRLILKSRHISHMIPYDF